MCLQPVGDYAFSRFLLEGRLMGSICGCCQATYVPPRAICPNCRAIDMGWVEMNGTGNLAAFTCIYIGTSALQAEGFSRDNPYCSGVVVLDEGPRVVARIEEVNTQKPEVIMIGMPVEVRFLYPDLVDRPKAVLAFAPR